MTDRPVAIDPSCMDDYDPNSLTVEQAWQRIREALGALAGNELLPVSEALGRVAALDVPSPIAVPPTDNSAMDGYALRHADLPVEGVSRLRVIGESFAGRPFQGAISAGQAVRIMTGAVIPDGCDTVVMQERVEREGDDVRVGGDCKPGEHVRNAGDDIRPGQVVIEAGARLMPAALGVLASLGIAEVLVHRRPRVAFFSTGDELCSVGEIPGPGDIYDSNRYTLNAMIRRVGAEPLDLGVVRDRREDVRAAFRQAAELGDMVITSGGVSVGEADFVKETLEEMGQVGFWKIAMKPGRPLAFGRLDQAFFFGLPGNPVSVMATFYQFVQPALRRMMGEPDPLPVQVPVRCVSKLKKSPGRMELQRGILAPDENGQMTVSTTGLQGSHVLTSMSKANCFIILPLESNGAEPGESVLVQPFEGLI